MKQKKNKYWGYSLIVIGLVFIFIFTYSCKKNNNNITPSPTTNKVIDIDGNVYDTVTIGKQTWMVENLKVTHFNDGTDIPLVTDITVWKNLVTPGYCWYNNDAATYKATYGALYNWYTVNTGKLCPKGWHVPTNTEWTTLSTFLGGDNKAGGILKETGTTHWRSPNSGATNDYGFTGLPGGTLLYSGPFNNLTYYGNWWSANAYDNLHAYYRIMCSGSSEFAQDDAPKAGGNSVRCIKD